MTNREVAERFLAGRAGSAEHLFSDGTKLFSYSTCIAQWAVNYSGEHSRNILIGNSTKYSNTTSRHLGYVKNRVDNWTNNSVPRGTNNLLEYV